jgi:hypothetical protein
MRHILTLLKSPKTVRVMSLGLLCRVGSQTRLDSGSLSDLVFIVFLVSFRFCNRK